MKRLLFVLLAFALLSCSNDSRFDVVNGMCMSGSIEDVHATLENNGIKEDSWFRKDHQRVYKGSFLGIDNCSYIVYNIPGKEFLDKYEAKYTGKDINAVWRVYITNTRATAEQVDKVIDYYQKKYKDYAGDWADKNSVDGTRVRGGEFWMEDDYQIVVKAYISDETTLFRVYHMFWNVPGSDAASIIFDN